MPDLAYRSLVKRSRGFLQTPRYLAARGGVIVESRFDPLGFHPALCDDLGLTLPAALSRASDRRRAEFIAGRALACLAQAALGIVPRPVAFGADRAPVWPAGLSGSISHAGDHCACFVLPADLGTAGIDLEEMAEGCALQAILDLAMTSEEVAIIGACPDLRIAATLCFSAKEAAFKALYPKVCRFIAHRCAVLDAPPRAGRLRLRLTERLHRDLPEGHAIDLRYETRPGSVLTWTVLPGRGERSPDLTENAEICRDERASAPS